MILNGWKEIAGHLKCGVRTAHRWHRYAHLPVRGGDKDGTPVRADSQKLDEWLRRRSSLAGLIEQTTELIKTSSKAGREFLWTELCTGREFAKLASSSTTSRAAARRTRAARVAYNTLQRILTRKVSIPEEELKRLKAGLREFRGELEKLGETF